MQAKATASFQNDKQNGKENKVSGLFEVFRPPRLDDYERRGSGKSSLWKYLKPYCPIAEATAIMRRASRIRC